MILPEIIVFPMDIIPKREWYISPSIANRRYYLINEWNS